jgi:general nucleoside transport system permease protein
MNDSVLVATIAGAVLAGTPLILAALGEIIAERSGVMNLGIEGMMLFGGVMGIVVTLATRDPLTGIAAAAAAGAALSLVHAVLSISLKVNQIVSGLALVILGTGLSSFIGAAPATPLSQRPPVQGFGPLLPKVLADLPVAGPILFGHDVIVYLSWGLVAATSFYLWRTTPGLTVRAVGEDAATADAAGIRVETWRYVHTLIGGALAGAAGGYFTIALTASWQSGITAGSGWIAFALVSFSGWSPWRALIAAYLFGALTNLAFTLQLAGVAVPGSILAAIPFVATYIAIIVISARPGALQRRAPGNLAVPYWRESR